uniref:Uncharacterized protein n=1 Tax=Medicago truncatula TaxID=3880 RepID=I3SG03_MEDTR|nr:unknown [Medicago truncatula]
MTPSGISKVLLLKDSDLPAGWGSTTSSIASSSSTIDFFADLTIRSTPSMASTVRSKTIIFSENLWCSTPSLAIRRRKEKLLN